LNVIVLLIFGGERGEVGIWKGVRFRQILGSKRERVVCVWEGGGGRNEKEGEVFFTCLAA